MQKYRHYLYDWLGVDKVELAIMTELLLRGDQTVGELRGRASRMEPIADLAALQPLLESLRAKGLLVSLTPEGRGQVVTHALYTPREMESLRAKHQGGGQPPAEAEAAASPAAHAPASAASAGQAVRRSQPAASQDAAAIESLRRELSQVREHVAQLDRDMAEMRDANGRLGDQLQALKDALGG